MKIKIVILFLLLISGIAHATGEGVGQNDTTTLDDYLNSFTARIISYNPNLWRLDADSSEIKQAFNDAMLEVSKLSGATEWADSIFMDSSFWYDLPADFQSMARVSIMNPLGPGEVGLDSIIIGDIGKNTLVGEDRPKYYTIWNRRIYFDINNYLMDTVFIYYNAYPTKLDTLGAISNVSKYYFNIVVDEAILNFYSGRTGAAVSQILALAERRLAKEYAKMGVEHKSITPEVR
jgi:hypothetical protein